MTDPLQIIANPLDTVKTSELFSFLEGYLNDEDVSTLVFGSAKHKDGTGYYFEDEIRDLVVKLQNSFPRLHIDYQDEAFTSMEAKEILVKSGSRKKKRMQKENIDKVSAVLILQRYLGHI